MRVAPGANGSCPLSTDDATKPTSIIPLSNPQTRTTGFQGTRIYMAEPPGTKSGSLLPVLYCETPRHFFVNSLFVVAVSPFSARDSEPSWGASLLLTKERFEQQRHQNIFLQGLLTAGCAGENLSTSCASSSPVKSGVFACRAQTLALSG